MPTIVFSEFSGCSLPRMCKFNKLDSEVITGTILSASSEDTLDNGAKENTLDWLPYTFWKPVGGQDEWIRGDFTNSEIVNYLYIFRHTLGSRAINVKLQKSVDGNTWVDVLDFTPADDTCIYKSFTQDTSLFWRVLFINVPPIDGMVISGAGTAAANGTYKLNGLINSRPSYLKVGGLETIQWTGTEWHILDCVAAILYKSTEDVAGAELVVTWVLDTGANPLPTLALLSDNGIDLGIVSFGVDTEFEFGPGPGFSSVLMSEKPKLLGGESRDGNPMPVSIINQGAEFTIKLDLISDSWMRTEWHPLKQALQVSSAGFLWNPAQYPDESCFVWPRNRNNGLPADVYSEVVTVAITIPLKALIA